jgi:hypothetical protein
VTVLYGPSVERVCRSCGKAFRGYRISRNYCSRACSMRAWRAVKMLEGSYENRDGQFKKVSP